MKAQANLVAAAFSLTALAYGLARFAYGLLLPRIRDELALGVETAGWIGGGAFAAYCAGILLTFYCNGRLGPRAVALAAGLAATAGMGLVAIASSGWTLGLGIALAGLSTGLASPPLATAVASRIGAADRPKANGIINTGTAAGIVLSGAASLLAAEAWREIYLVFVAIGAVVTAWLWFAMPALAGTGLLRRGGRVRRRLHHCIGGLPHPGHRAFAATAGSRPRHPFPRLGARPGGRQSPVRQPARAPWRAGGARRVCRRRLRGGGTASQTAYSVIATLLAGCLRAASVTSSSLWRLFQVKEALRPSTVTARGFFPTLCTLSAKPRSLGSCALPVSVCRPISSWPSA